MLLKIKNLNINKYEQIYIKNLSNKFPTKDITKDDKINKLPISTSKKIKK